MAEYTGIMVIVESAEGMLANITRELLGCGRKLADELSEELSAAILGDSVSSLSKEVTAYGADKVYIADKPFLKNYSNDTYTNTMEAIVKQVMPKVLLLGQTAIGRDLAPSLAFRLSTSATTDCIELSIDVESGQLLQTKPIYGGNAKATFISECYPQIAAVRPKVYSPTKPDDSRQGEIIIIDTKLESVAIRTKVIDKVSRTKEGIRLEDAAVVIAGGRGIGSAEGFKQLEELADLLGGAVGATRPPCDNGWIRDSAQIGLTGKIIAPEFYMAIALSGSSQHISGCSGARNIIAINKDAEANIFNVARFGIADDWKKVLPAFTEKVRKLLAK
ncbi:MAG: electron transfer flavoprotein subunit alpha/FixB family protein [Dehalococcoidia bacterium]|nr:MAG: electron transfer flavoprotein subunit alpha/FixB family protein [Dehalococcoidia bacterium]